MSQRVAVIGAGVSGLPAIKHCLEEGLDPVCFEMRSDLGGLWNYQDAVINGRSSVMNRTSTISSKETYCYSDFPVPDKFPVFMPHKKLLEYLRMYAKKFDLEKHIRYNCEVMEVSQGLNFSSTGSWNVTVKNHETDKTTTESFDGVLICHGHHQQRHIPQIQGQDVFKGTQIHSNEYRRWNAFEGKRVVIVGLGVSGAEIASELSQVCSQVILSTRRGVWMIGRIAEFGVPYDLMYNRQVMKFLIKYLPAALINYILVTLLNLKFDHELFGMEPKHPILNQNAFINDELPMALITGKIRLRGDVESITEDAVLFENGEKEEKIDAIIYSTGYNLEFPFLKDKSYKLKNNMTSAYKFVFPPDLQKPTLALIGCMEPFGAIMPVSELQSRWAARIVKGTSKLPSVEHMKKEIEQRNERIEKSYISTMRHRIHYDWMTHLDDIAEEIGCKPDMFALLKSDPKLALTLFFGPSLPVHYRLTGPGAWAQARQTIFGVWDRIAAPMKTRRVVVGSWRSVGLAIKIVILLAAIFWFWFVIW